MRISVLKHVPFEGPGIIENWAKENNHIINIVELYSGQKIPSIGSFDFLLVMGGPMNIYEEDSCSFLKDEKHLIKQAVYGGKMVLGICLGAQLIADIMGAKVVKNHYKEIGWFPVQKTEAVSSLLKGLPEKFTAFHWHGDTFKIPKGLKSILKSESCRNQAFEYKNRVLALQFHLESTEESIKSITENCADEIIPGKYIQTSDEILNKKTYIENCNKYMYIILDNMAKKV